MDRRKPWSFRSPTRRRRPVVGRCFERLETRRLLATLTVGGGGDFTTVQEAVDRARSGDVIAVADGTYAESVDLSRMGSAIGKQPGNLTIQGTGPAAVVDSPGGPAFSNSAAFQGDLTIQRMTLRSATSTPGDDSGLHLDDYSGTLTVTSILVTETQDTGISISNSSGTAVIRDNEVSDGGTGADDHGILVDRFNGIVLLRENSVRDMTGDGIVVLVSGSDQLVAAVSDSSVAGDPVAFESTNDGIRVEATGGARLDVTVDNNSLDDLDQHALRLLVADSARVQARLDDNIVFNSNETTSIDVRVQDTAGLAFSFADNTLSDSRGDSVQLSLGGSAEVNAYLQNNLFFNIGDGADDDGLLIASDSGSDGVLNAYLDFNDFVTVKGVGMSITADGSTVFNITATENSYSDVNTASGQAAVEIATESTSVAANMNLDFVDNTVNQSSQGDYRFEQRGSGLFRLEGTEPTAAAQVESTNDGTLSSVGAITVVATGSFDATQPVMLGDTAWNDENADGIQQSDVEDGQPDILFTLTGVETNGGRAVERTTISGSSGRYAFSSLLPGDYTIRIEPVLGFSLTDAQQGDDAALDSDFPRNTRTTNVTLVNGTDNFDIDAGFIRNWQNPVRPTDVNGDSLVAPIDALILINDLNARGSRPLPLPPLPPNEPPPYLDVNGDTQIAPIDVLLVINFLNSGGSGEGESSQADVALSNDAVSNNAVADRDLFVPPSRRQAFITDRTGAALDTPATLDLRASIGRHSPLPVQPRAAQPRAARDNGSPTDLAERDLAGGDLATWESLLDVLARDMAEAG